MSINRNLANFATKVTSDGNSYIEITVTVAGGKFVIDGTSQQIVSLAKGQTYRFDNSDSSNSGHPFVFSTDSSNSSAFTTGVSTNGTAGSSGAYVEVTLEQDAPDRIFYYCSNHSNMGAMVKTAPVGDANFATFVDTFTFPTSDGSADQVLKTDGSGALSFGTSSGGIASVAADTTPQLGGDLDVNGNSIVSASNANISITPNGSGKVIIDGLSHPTSDGSANQVLKTDGSGNLSFVDQSSGGIASVAADTTPQLGGDLDVNGNSIVSASNGNIAITPNGTGKIILDGLSFPTSDGSADQVLKTDGSGQLSFVDQSSGGGGGSLTATASGALTDGSLVAINSDGTVSAIKAAVSQSIGSATNFGTGTHGTQNEIFIKAAYDTQNNKVVIVYKDTQNSLGKAVVGTVSGSSISFGTPVTFLANNINVMDVSYDTSAQKVLVVYRDANQSNHGYGKVGTVSGTSISFGSATEFEDGLITHLAVAYDENVNKHLVVFADYNDSSYGKAVVATISGTSVSFGSAVTYVSNEANYNSVVYDSTNQKMVVAWNRATTATEAAVATISGTSVSFGTTATVASGYHQHCAATFDSGSGKVIVGYQNRSNDTGYAAVGTVSGTGISFGTAVQFETDETTYISMSYNPAADKTIITYLHGGNSGSGYYIIGTVSGTSISFGTAAQFEAGAVLYGNKAIYDPDSEKHVLVFSDDGDASKGKALVFTQAIAGGATLTAENFIGISDGAYADSATATIQTAGSVDDAQSGLTAGQTYYVQASGALGLSPDTISVVAGTAVSATKLLINPDSDPTITTYTDSDVNSHLNVSGASSGEVLSWNGSDYAWVPDQHGQLTATASGTLADGSMVILNSDGTVSKIGTVQVNSSAGSETTFSSSSTGTPNVVYDSNAGRVVVAYQDYGDSSKGKAVVGTISGTSITFGTAVEFASSVEYMDMVYEPNAQKVVISYQDEDNSDYCSAIVGTVDSSDNSISFGSETNFGDPCYQTRIAYDANAQKVVVVYRRKSDHHGRAAVGTISGTGISFGSASTFNSGYCDYFAVEYDKNAQKTVIAYRDYNDSNRRGFVTVCTISSTSISFGTEVALGNFATNFALAYDDNASKLAVFYVRSFTSRGRVISISGTTPSFGTEADTGIWENGVRGGDAVYHTAAQKLVFVAKDNSSTYVEYVIGTISGTDISFNTPIALNSNSVDHPNIAYVDGSVVTVFKDTSNSNTGDYVVFNIAYSLTRALTAENFIGVSDAAYTDGQTVTVQLAGTVDDAQSGLTAGQTYYVQSDGTLGLSPDTISVQAGTAISATKLLINPDSDPAPKLNADLDVNGNSIVSASNGNIAITPNGSGKIILDGLSFPTSDGSADQVLKTDGSGQLSFTDQSGGGSSTPTFGAIQRVAMTVASSASSLNSTDFVTYSGSGNKRYKGFMTWQNNSGTDNFQLYMSTSAASNIVSGSINGLFKNSSTLTNEALERFYGTWDDTNNRFNWYLPLYSTSAYTWTQGDIFTHTYNSYPRYPMRYTYIEFDVVLSGSWQGGINTDGGFGSPTNAEIVYTEVS